VIYERMNIPDQGKNVAEQSKKRWGTRKVTVDSVEIIDKNNPNEKNIVGQGSEIEINIRFKNRLPSSENITIGLAFQDTFGINISGPNSQKVKLKSDRDVRFKIPKLSFIPGEYSLTIAIFDENSE